MEKKNCKLSIIIPVYNIVRYLRRCLESIVAQSFSDFEIILVNDGSTDGSSELCDEWQQRNSRIRVYHKTNGGVSSARNIGIENAEGEFITFVDGDDYILPGMYERMMELQVEHDTDIVICGFSQEQKDGSFVPNYCCNEVKTLSQQEQVLCLLSNTYYTCSCWDKIFRRELVNNLRFDEKITHYEDLLFCYEAMKHSKRAVFTAEAFYHYCANDSSSASRKPFGDKQMTMLDAWDYIHNDGLQCFPKLKGIINSQYYRNYIMCAMMALSAHYQSEEAWKRIKGVISNSLFNLFFCPSLAIGYKWNAIKILMSRNN
ncbi:MAG: glycosyltransferase [Treponema sp.]|nr:glycosyltransferase [Treponema sp.]